MDKRARKLFRDFTDASISRVEASRKRTLGNNPFIDATFAYISSRSDDDSHYFGHVVEKDKKPPCKTGQPVFYKPLGDGRGVQRLDQQAVEAQNDDGRVLAPPRPEESGG
jgi:hypothetical protein